MNDSWPREPQEMTIAHNKKANDTVEIFSPLSYTNVNVLPFTEVSAGRIDAGPIIRKPIGCAGYRPFLRFYVAVFNMRILL